MQLIITAFSFPTCTRNKINKNFSASFDLFDDGMQQVNFDIYHKIESIFY